MRNLASRLTGDDSGADALEEDTPIVQDLGGFDG